MVITELTELIGRRVISIAPIDRYPMFCFNQIGLRGTIIEVTTNGDIYIQLDEHFKDLEEWKNCIHIYKEHRVNEDVLQGEFVFTNEVPTRGMTFLYAGAMFVIIEIKNCTCKTVMYTNNIPQGTRNWNYHFVKNIIRNPSFYR